MLRTIGDRLADEGHRVTVLSTQPSYKIEIENERRPYRESLGQLDVRRVRLLPERSRATWIRGLNSLLFVWKIFWHLLVYGGRYDFVMCSTVPPVLTGTVTSLGCRLRGCKFLYHAMDIWPEVAQCTGQMRTGLVYRLLRTIDTWSCRAASMVICLSDDMRRTYLKRDQRLDHKVCVIGNFELPSYDTDSDESVPAELKKEPGKFRVLFAGNLGRYQGLGAVVRAASLVQNPRVEFALMGAGSEFENLHAQAKELGCLDKCVVFLPHQPVRIAKALMRDADISLVTLSAGVSTVAYPSKTLTLLAMGCPLAVMTETDSDLSKMVRENELGFSVACDDSQGMAAAISRLANDHDQMQSIRKNVVAHAKVHAVQEAVLPHWSRLIWSLSQSRDHAIISADAAKTGQPGFIATVRSNQTDNL